MADAAAAYRAALLEGLRPEQLGTVWEWADRHRILGGVGCPEPGPWRTDRTPHLREPMECLSARSPWRRVVLMFGSQTGKTEVGLNWLGYIIHWRPAPTLLVQPTLEMAKRLNRQRLEPLLRDTPELHALVRSVCTSVGGYPTASSFCGRTRVLWSSSAGCVAVREE